MILFTLLYVKDIDNFKTLWLKIFFEGLTFFISHILKKQFYMTLFVSYNTAGISLTLHYFTIYPLDLHFISVLPSLYHRFTSALPPVYLNQTICFILLYLCFTSALPPLYFCFTSDIPPLYLCFTSALPPLYLRLTSALP